MIHNFIFLGDGGGQVRLKGDIQVSSNKMCNCNAICYSVLGQCCLKQFFNVSLLFNYQIVEAHTHVCGLQKLPLGGVLLIRRLFHGDVMLD